MILKSDASSVKELNIDNKINIVSNCVAAPGARLLYFTLNSFSECPYLCLSHVPKFYYDILNLGIETMTVWISRRCQSQK